MVTFLIAISYIFYLPNTSRCHPDREWSNAFLTAVVSYIRDIT